MRAATSEHQAGRGDRYKWVALANTTASMFMATLDGSIVIIALPASRSSTTSWTASSPARTRTRPARASRAAWLETFTDARVERYWQLLAILNGQPVPPSGCPPSSG